MHIVTSMHRVSTKEKVKHSVLKLNIIIGVSGYLHILVDTSAGEINLGYIRADDKLIRQDQWKEIDMSTTYLKLLNRVEEDQILMYRVLASIINHTMALDTTRLLVKN